MRARSLIATSARRRSPWPSSFHTFQRTSAPQPKSSLGSPQLQSRALHRAGLVGQPAAAIIQPTATQTAATEHPPERPPAFRYHRLKDAKPFSDFLTDTFNRQHTYLRISVTERCNLRCLYCMPAEGVPLSPPAHLLTTPEIVLLSSVFVSQGVTKIRLTGGEPTVRRDILPLMHQIGELRSKGLRELCITTNGISLHRKLDAMVEAGLTGVNMSLDTLDPFQFQIMTRRKGFDAVLRSMDRILDMNAGGAGVKLKVNCVVMRGINDAEIPAFVEMTRHKDLEVRFIEYMPFDGNKWSEGKMLPYKDMLDRIREVHPTIEQVPGHKTDTSKTWRVPGFAGRVGFITSMTSNFCGGCNRLRITGDGNLKVCLFGNAEVSLRDVVRRLNKGEPIDEEALEAIRQLSVSRAQAGAGNDGVDVLAKHEEELLNVIGVAVKRKKAKHAGIGQLEHMKNRPMILIVCGFGPPSLQYQESYGTFRGQQPRLKVILGSASTTSLPTGHPRAAPASLSPSAARPPWATGNLHPFMFTQGPQASHFRLFSTTPRRHDNDDAKDSSPQPRPKLTHVSDSGSAHMVSISSKAPTSRIATAACRVTFSTRTPLDLIRQNTMKKGDVLGVARVAGIMASKRTADLIPLCHPIPISHVGVELSLDEKAAAVEVRATVTCDGKTGVEMEALTAASTAALTIYDMCKAVDKGMVIGGLRVVLKDGGKSGRWEMP